MPTECGHRRIALSCCVYTLFRRSTPRTTGTSASRPSGAAAPPFVSDSGGPQVCGSSPCFNLQVCQDVRMRLAWQVAGAEMPGRLRIYVVLYSWPLVPARRTSRHCVVCAHAQACCSLPWLCGHCTPRPVDITPGAESHTQQRVMGVKLENNAVGSRCGIWSL